MLITADIVSCSPEGYAHVCSIDSTCFTVFDSFSHGLQPNGYPSNLSQFRKSLDGWICRQAQLTWGGMGDGTSGMGSADSRDRLGHRHY